jgi:Holliday junction resolvasome RuvABC ATP-dependent DNA helicase subunit
MEYNSKEKQKIIQRYLTQNNISTSPEILKAMANKVDAVPREIHNFCIKLRDFVVTNTDRIDAGTSQRSSTSFSIT